MNKQEFEATEIGTRVGLVYGPGEFPQHNPGTVTAKIEDRYGFHLGVHLDKGNHLSVDGFTETGIGCYLLKKEVSK